MSRSAGSLIEKNKVYTDGVIFIKWRMILAVVNAIYAIAWEKPEKKKTSTGFEPVTSRYWCDAL